MRTPNTQCHVCAKPLYRRPFELAKIRYVACLEHREVVKKTIEPTEAQKIGLAQGRRAGKVSKLIGTKRTDECKQAISAAHKKWCSENPDRVISRGKKIRGENHYNWKGGADRINAAIRRLTEHGRWIREVKYRDGKCCKCGSVFDLEAHHIKPVEQIIKENQFSSVQDLRDCAELWDLKNGETLCRKCHYETHGKKYTVNGKGRKHQPKKGPTRPRGKDSPNYKGGERKVNCIVCNTEITVKPCELSKRKFCSKGCFHENQRKKVPVYADLFAGIV